MNKSMGGEKSVVVLNLFIIRVLFISCTREVLLPCIITLAKISSVDVVLSQYQCSEEHGIPPKTVRRHKSCCSCTCINCLIHMPLKQFHGKGPESLVLLRAKGNEGCRYRKTNGWSPVLRWDTYSSTYVSILALPPSVLHRWSWVGCCFTQDQGAVKSDWFTVSGYTWGDGITPCYSPEGKPRNAEWVIEKCIGHIAMSRWARCFHSLKHNWGFSKVNIL